jgi:hypothetical protein
MAPQFHWVETNAANIPEQADSSRLFRSPRVLWSNATRGATAVQRIDRLSTHRIGTPGSTTYLRNRCSLMETFSLTRPFRVSGYRCPSTSCLIVETRM